MERSGEVAQDSSTKSLPAVSQVFSNAVSSKPRKITVYRLGPKIRQLTAPTAHVSPGERILTMTNSPVASLSSHGNSEAGDQEVERCLSTPSNQPQDDGNSDRDSELYRKFASSDKIPITCRNKHAYLFKAKLGSGKKGKCIYFENAWFTPSEFENHCGLEMSKDWKRSLRYGGKSMQNLIQKGILRPHSSICTCGTCCDDASVDGPVLFYSPKPRRKRSNATAFPHVSSFEYPSTNQGYRLNTSEPSISISTPLGIPKDNSAQIPEELFNLLRETSTPFHEIIRYIFEAVSKNTAEDRKSWSQLKSKADEIFQKYAKLQEAIERTKLECDERRNNLLQEIITTLKNCDTSEYGISSKALDKPLVGGQDEVVYDEAMEICQACGQPAISECTGCHKATYCSTACQETDWNAGHRDVCRRLQSHISNPQCSVDGMLS